MKRYDRMPDKNTSFKLSWTIVVHWKHFYFYLSSIIQLVSQWIACTQHYRRVVETCFRCRLSITYAVQLIKQPHNHNYSHSHSHNHNHHHGHNHNHNHNHSHSHSHNHNHNPGRLAALHTYVHYANNQQALLLRQSAFSQSRVQTVKCTTALLGPSGEFIIVDSQKCDFARSLLFMLWLSVKNNQCRFNGRRYWNNVKCIHLCLVVFTKLR